MYETGILPPLQARLSRKKTFGGENVAPDLEAELKVNVRSERVRYSDA